MQAFPAKLLLIIPVFFVSQANAAIFVCKDSRHKITYQDEPCSGTTLRQLKNVPDAPLKDQIAARERINKANLLSFERAKLAETERQQQDLANREYQALAMEKRKLELLETQRAESEQAQTSQWIAGTGFGINRFNNYPLNPYQYGSRQFGADRYVKRNYQYNRQHNQLGNGLSIGFGRESKRYGDAHQSPPSNNIHKPATGRPLANRR